MNYSRFNRLWSIEWLRQRELAHGSQLRPELEQQLARQHHSAEGYISARAEHSEAAATAMQQRWHQLRRVLLLIMMMLLIGSGIGLASAVLGLPKPISLSHAWLTLLGLHLLMLLLWLWALLQQRESGMAAWLLQLAQQARFGQGVAGASQAWWQVMQQQRLLLPCLSALTHGAWLLLLSSAWLWLFLTLSAQSYPFTWATTILAEPQLQQLMQLLGAVPKWLLGVTVPSREALLAAEPLAQQHAGRWLLAALLCYGVLPRLLLLMVSVLWLSVRYQRMQLSLQQPGLLPLQQFWQQQQATTTRIVDADSGDGGSLPSGARVHAGKGCFVLHLDHQLAAWLPPPLNALPSLGVVASGADKRALLQRLAGQPAQCVVAIIDASLSPDRGSLRFLQTLQSHCQQLLLWLHGDPELRHWPAQLARYQLSAVSNEAALLVALRECPCSR